ncbi:MAG: ZIP family metal transporter [bacterium]|nr:ZIP family metal transporter [bacterium]
MDSIALLIAITCVTGIGSGVIGASVASAFNLDSNRLMSMVISFAAGLMLAIICFDFIPDALEAGEGAGHALLIVGTIALGVIVVAALNKIMDSRMQKKIHCCTIDDPNLAQVIDERTRSEHLKLHEQAESHSAHADGGLHDGHGMVYEGQSRSTLLLAGWVMAVAIALHNLPAGMSIGASFSIPSMAMVKSGIVIAVLIGIHSIPEAMAMAVPFRYAGLSRAKTIAIAALVGAMVVVGAVIGFVLGEIGETWFALCLAFASGSMLYVLFGEMLPEAILLFHSKKPALAVIGGILVGLILIVIL